MNATGQQWSDSYKFFCKCNFCNDNVITKIMKVFHYENLKLYGTTSELSLQNTGIYILTA